MDLPDLYTVLYWILPPLLGAIIGYVTNDIAIRMLFRPLTEKKILGLRVPFTPGIIPKQRYELAESIGVMVSRELLTEEVLRRQVHSPEFLGRIHKGIASLVDNFAGTRLARLQEGQYAVFYTSLERFLEESLYRFFTSRSFIGTSRALITRLVQSLGERPLADLLGRFDLAGVVAGRILPLLTGPEARKRVAAGVSRWLRENRKAGTSLGRFIPEEAPGLLAGPLSSFLPLLLDALFRWLREDATREQLEQRGKLLLRDALDRLNLLQKLIVSAGAFDRTLEQKMPEILEDALDSLEDAAADEGNRQKVVQAVVGALARWREKGLGEVLDGREEQVERAVGQLFHLLDQERVRKGIARAVAKLVGDNGHRPVREIVARYLGVQENQIVDFASFRLLDYLARRETSRRISEELVALVRHFLEDQSETTVGALLSLDPARRESLAALFTERLVRILDQRLPDLIRSFDFQGLVVQKVNQLNVAEVERLLMLVIAKQLKWINLFGAILGAIIGFSQLLLRLVQ
jgi:uncharacterized membrane protein YheB (UPF0754 family)